MLNTQATGAFRIKAWIERAYDSIGDGARLAQASVTQIFHGDIEGRGTAEFLMVYQADGTGSFVGLQRVVGRIGQRAGSFVLQVYGTFRGEMVAARWFVVPDSGTGQLRGLRGQGGFPPYRGRVVPFTLDYDFPVEEESAPIRVMPLGQQSSRARPARPVRRQAS